MIDSEILDAFLPSYSDIDKDLKWLLEKRPLLAHYTSIDVIDKILSDDEIWFSNPLFMNDLEEMRFGLLEGRRAVENSEAIDLICGTKARSDILKNAFAHYFSAFENEHAIDVYVFCLSEHDPQNQDGLLSMWRGYGGRGNGAALVFNTGFVTARPDSPLLIMKVIYESRENRLKWIEDKIKDICRAVMFEKIPDDKLYLVAHHIFNLIKVTSLKFKHHGFREECEWRIVYMPDRDPNGILKERFGYAVSSRGVEPKLKFQVRPLEFEPAATWSFSTIIEQIILGPSLSSPLARSAVEKMLLANKKGELRQKLSVSSIPLRPLS